MEEVLLIAGDVKEAGAFPSSIALLETGLIQVTRPSFLHPAPYTINPKPETLDPAP